MTTLLLVFASVLLLAVLLSNLAKRTILSTAVIFLVAGFLCGEGVTGLIPLGPDEPDRRDAGRVGAVLGAVHRRDAGGLGGSALGVAAAGPGAAARGCRSRW